MFTFFRNPWSEPSTVTQQPVPAAATISSVLLISDTRTGGEASRIQRDFEQSFKYASSASAARGGAVPRTFLLPIPDHLKQGIAEWLNATQGTGIGLEVSAVLLHPSAAPDRADLPTESERCTFLSLPPEMRNKIYRFTLVETDKISIPPNGPLPAEPGLLSTCTQIRAEASGMYYKQNKFLFAINRHDACQYIKWCRSSESRRHVNQSILVSRLTNWPNLLHWLDCYYHDQCGNAGVNADGSPTFIDAHLFNVVKQLRQHSCLSWPQVKAILVDVRNGLGTQNAKWLDDASC